jgi:sugar diacid utilization regulator
MAARRRERQAETRGGSALQRGWPTLGEVLVNLDSEVLALTRAPAGNGARVNDVVIFDATDPHSIRAGAIVIGVGISRRDAEAVTLVERAGRAGAVAVALRSEHELPARVLEAADSLGVALLEAPPQLTWGQLYSLLRTAIGSAGSTGEPEAAGIPVGDLFALADAVATSVGGPVTIEDPHWRVLAYSNLDHQIDEARRQTILGRIPPDVWQRRLEEAGVARALRSGDGVVRFDGFEDLAPRLAVPVLAGGELLGSIWVAEAGTPLDADAESALLRVAQRAAIHLITHRASDDVKRRTRGAFVRELLDGRAPAGSVGETALRTPGPFTVLAFELSERESRHEAVNPDRVLSVISLYCEDAHRDAMCALVGDRFWALLPTPHRRPRERMVELAATIVRRVDQVLNVRLAAGIGASVPGVAQVPRSRRAAEQALGVLSRRDIGTRVVHIEDVRAHAVLLELLELAAERPGLLAGKLSNLAEHDRREGTSYVSSLRAYLDCRADVSEAARRIGVHPNTLRYRVRRLVEISGLDLDDPDERLVTEFQLRMAEPAPGT